MSGRTSRSAESVALALLIAAPLFAQEKATDPRAVQPERPTFATHAHTVIPGYVELETGVQGDRVGRGQRVYAVPTVMKIGLRSHVQLNLNTPAQASGPEQASGIGDASIGVKWRLLDDHPVFGDLALLPALKFPTGSTTNGTGTGTLDVGMTVIASYDVRGAAIDLNVAYVRVGGQTSSGPSSTALWTASFGLPVIGRLGWTAEFFGQPTVDGSRTPSTAALLTGPTYLVSTAFSVDAGVIAPFRGDLPNAVYAGMVWNLGSLSGHQERAVGSRAR